MNFSEWTIISNLNAWNGSVRVNTSIAITIETEFRGRGLHFPQSHVIRFVLGKLGSKSERNYIFIKNASSTAFPLAELFFRFFRNPSLISAVYVKMTLIHYGAFGRIYS